MQGTTEPLFKEIQFARLFSSRYVGAQDPPSGEHPRDGA